MNATIAPSPWPAPTPSASPRAPWRFAQVLQTPGGVVVRWVLQRNGSLSPRQTVAVFGGVGLVAVTLALFFWLRGAPLVLPFAGLEVLALGAAVLAHVRHATDNETLTLQDGLLRVEHHHGRRIHRAVFRALWVRVEPQHGDHSLVELSGQGQRAHVGRYLRPQARPALARELRQALRGDAGSLKDSDWN